MNNIKNKFLASAKTVTQLHAHNIKLDKLRKYYSTPRGAGALLKKNSQLIRKHKKQFNKFVEDVNKYADMHNIDKDLANPNEWNRRWKNVKKSIEIPGFKKKYDTANFKNSDDAFIRYWSAKIAHEQFRQEQINKHFRQLVNEGKLKPKRTKGGKTVWVGEPIPDTEYTKPMIIREVDSDDTLKYLRASEKYSKQLQDTILNSGGVLGEIFKINNDTEIHPVAGMFIDKDTLMGKTSLDINTNLDDKLNKLQAEYYIVPTKRETKTYIDKILDVKHYNSLRFYKKNRTLLYISNVYKALDKVGWTEAKDLMTDIIKNNELSKLYDALIESNVNIIFEYGEELETNSSAQQKLVDILKEIK